MAYAKLTQTGNTTGADLGFENKLWTEADKLPDRMDASERKHAVLSLIFLKYIFGACQARQAELDLGGVRRCGRYRSTRLCAHSRAVCGGGANGRWWGTV